MNADQLAHQAIHEHGAVQKLPELQELIQRLDGIPLRRVLEIGSQHGGSFWLWCQLAAPDAQLLALDLTLREFDYPVAQRDQELFFLQADSHAPETLEAVRDFFQGPLDLLFIDGDHSYAGAKQDYRAYTPLVANGGLVVLHDIVIHDPSVGCEVERLWAELDGDKWESIFPHRVDIRHAVLPADSCGLGALRIVR